jgi:hypothetical protein
LLHSDNYIKQQNKINDNDENVINNVNKSNNSNEQVEQVVNNAIIKRSELIKYFTIHHISTPTLKKITQDECIEILKTYYKY